MPASTKRTRRFPRIPSHMVVCDGSHQLHPHTFWCQHCGAAEPFNPPVAVSKFVAWGKAFTKRHAACPAPVLPEEDTRC